MAKMVLWGGEKDGLGINGELKTTAEDCPEVFYAVPNVDEDKIKRTRGKEAKQELREKLSVLAYKFDESRSTADTFVMVRNAALDRVSQR